MWNSAAGQMNQLGKVLSCRILIPAQEGFDRFHHFGGFERFGNILLSATSTPRATSSGVFFAVNRITRDIPGLLVALDAFTDLKPIQSAA